MNASFENPVIELSKQVFDTRYFSISRTGADPLVPVNLFFGGIEHCDADYQIKRKEFPVFILEYVDDGEGTVQVEGRDHSLRRGCAFLYGPGIPCNIMNNKEHSLVKYFLTFLCPRVPLREYYQLDRLFFPDALGGAVGDLVKTLFHEAWNASEDSWLICSSYLDIILRKCSRSLRLEQHHRERAWHVFNRIREYIEDNFLELDRMDQIGSGMDLDVSYISRLFKRYYHLTPYQFLLRKKMEYALDILRQGNISVQETAQRVGFDDPFHFSRLFKKIKGVSPSQMRHRES